MSLTPISSPRQELRHLLKEYERNQKELSYHTARGHILKEKIESMVFSNIGSVYNVQQQVLVDWHEHRIGAARAARLTTQTQRLLVR